MVMRDVEQAGQGVSRAMTTDTASPRRRVLREEIKEHLIDAILSGRLKPGDRIIETRVAQEHGVSQAPVREALRDLELLGFVVSLPFRGTQVRQISASDLVQIYPIRAALEGVAGRAAATLIDDPTLEQLDGLLAEMYAACEQNDSRAHVEADVAFHRKIMEASGNRLILQYWESMQLEITTFLTMVLARRSLYELAERHVVLLAALRSRDPVLVETAMRRHIEEPGEWVLSQEQGQDGEGQPLGEELGSSLR
jgi:DNA-binding GntR family transcriptional regulator